MLLQSHIRLRLKAESRDVGTLRFMAAFFIAVKGWKQTDCPVAAACTMKMWHVIITESYLASEYENG